MHKTTTVTLTLNTQIDTNHQIKPKDLGNREITDQLIQYLMAKRKQAIVLSIEGPTRNEQERNINTNIHINI